MRNTKGILGACVLLLAGTALATPAAALKPNSFSMNCNQAQQAGFPTSSFVVTRNSGPTTPRPGSYSFGTGNGYTYGHGPLRNYGQSGSDMIFIDSFPLEPVAGKKTCEVRIDVKGVSNNVVNNDSVNLFLPSSQGVFYQYGIGWAHGTSVWSHLLTDNLGAWNYNSAAGIPVLKHSTTATLQAALIADAGNGIGTVDAFDIFVQDDSAVTQVKATYTVY